MSIRAKLKERGKTLRSWALERGYAPRTTYYAVRRWAHRADRQPLGGMSRQIMADLRRELGE